MAIPDFQAIMLPLLKFVSDDEVDAELEKLNNEIMVRLNEMKS